MINICIFSLLVAIVYGFQDNSELEDEQFRFPLEAVETVPYMAQILFKGKFLCGGCIRAENWILTAAHCFDRNKNTFDFEILTGTNYKGGSDGQRHKIKRIVVHHNYFERDLDAQNDIALIQLEEPMRFSHVQNSIKLAAIGYKSANHVKFTCLRHEIFLPNNQADSLIVKSINVPIIDQNECQQFYGGGITSNMFCAGTEETYTCEGDSGSPAVNDNGRLVGILSRGKDCDFKKAPGIFTKVPHYVSWIDEVTKIPSV